MKTRVLVLFRVVKRVAPLHISVENFEATSTVSGTLFFFSHAFLLQASLVRQCICLAIEWSIIL